MKYTTYNGQQFTAIPASEFYAFTEERDQGGDCYVWNLGNGNTLVLTANLDEPYFPARELPIVLSQYDSDGTPVGEPRKFSTVDETNEFVQAIVNQVNG